MNASVQKKEEKEEEENVVHTKGGGYVGQGGLLNKGGVGSLYILNSP
jgi:hypothetical protein